MKRCGGNEPEFTDIGKDEFLEEQPVLKLVKTEEEPSPSQEVLELREKVDKLEKEFQSVCRYARQFEVRLEESQAKLAETTAELEEARKGSTSSLTALRTLLALEKSENSVNQKRLAETSKELAFVTQELKQEKAQASVDQARLEEMTKQLVFVSKQLEGEKAQGDSDRERVVELWNLIQEREHERTYASEESRKDKEKIEYLSCMLAKYEGFRWLPPNPNVEQQQQQREPAGGAQKISASDSWRTNKELDDYKKKCELMMRSEELLKQFVPTSMVADEIEYKDTLNRIIFACIGKEQKINPKFDFSFSEAFKRGIVQYTKQYVQRHNRSSLARSDKSGHAPPGHPGDAPNAGKNNDDVGMDYDGSQEKENTQPSSSFDAPSFSPAYSPL